MFSIQIKTNIRAKCEILLHIINKLIPHGASGQWSGKELLFLESSLFSLGGSLLEWPTCSIFPHKGTTVSHDPQQRQTRLLANSELSFREREHTVFSKDITSQLPSLPACRSTPNHLGSTQALLQTHGNPVCLVRVTQALNSKIIP